MKEIWDKIILKLRVLDNACGSGAFLLAAANILFELNKKINDKLGAENPDTTLKIIILVNNLYGVDINPNGIEIAKLRLWLWLADSYEPGYIKPLPNIDYNLRVGNSLIGYVDLGEFKGAKLTISDFLHDEEKPTLDILLKERNDLIGEYKITWGEEAKELKSSVQELDVKISNLLNADLYREFREKKIKINREEFLRLNPFHWGFEFYEVFELDKPPEERGFDVVIGNPPYVRQEKIKDQKPIFEKLYQEVYDSTADLCVYFVKRSLDLTKLGGYHSFIITNKWIRARYGENLRRYMTENITIDEIVDFNGIRVFVGATVDVLVYKFKNAIPEENNLRYCAYKDTSILHIEKNIDTDGFDIEQETLKQGWIFYPKDVLEINRKIEEVGKPLKDLDIKIYRGITTGFNEAFVIDNETKKKLIEEDPKSVDLIKPLLRGRDIGKCYVNWKNLWIIVIPAGFTKEVSKNLNLSYREAEKFFSETYPSIYNHLVQFKSIDSKRGKGLVNRDDQGDFWWELRPCDYYQEFEKPKIISTKATKEPSFTLEPLSGYILNTSYALSTNSKVTLAILNSDICSFYLRTMGSRLSKMYEPKLSELEELAIPKVTQELDEIFNRLIDHLIFLNATEERRTQLKELIEFIDHQIIDSLVYELYFKEKFEEDGLKTSLLWAVESYLSDIEDLEADEEKLKVIKEVVEGIKSDDKVKKEIKRIKGHEWVKVVEGWL